MVPQLDKGDFVVLPKGKYEEKSIQVINKYFKKTNFKKRL